MMRASTLALLALACAGCAGAPEKPLREYLDEQTAATITVVAEPWIFSRERTNERLDERDYLNVYAINVNRMGDHRQYLAVLQSAPLRDAAGQDTPPPSLQWRASGEDLTFVPASENARALGVAQPVAESYTYESRWWYYPVDRRTLARIAGSRDVRASLVAGEVRAGYVLWRDGSAEAAALSSAIP
jgi:hypothetical protein